MPIAVVSILSAVFDCIMKSGLYRRAGWGAAAAVAMRVGVRLMRWVRNSRRFGSCLALAALALQLVLSFGHVHLDGLHRGFPAVTAGAQVSQSVPAQHPGNGADDDYCAICASIYLAANSFLPQAPQLPVPLAAQAVEHSSRVAAAFIAPRRAPFQSRAPPLA